MNHKDTIHYLKIVEIGKSKELPVSITEDLAHRELIELVFINDKKPAFNGNYIITDEGSRVLQSSR